MPRVLIVYASLTGNTKAGAMILKDTFENLSIEVDVMESFHADPFDYEDYDIAIAGTYTYGMNANLPDEILDFFEELKDVDLTGKVYGAFGSGDKFYVGKYCLCVDYFEEQFEKTNAIKGSDGVKYDLDPEEEDKKNLEIFAKELVEKYQEMN
ncbi:MAG: flavodoxin [Atopostipes suicloacalis]|nr:flavodoxin [Atopostipes suicloacalis]MDN6731067.1 flavodoxin [Atopostipes suicloacalis]